MARHLFLVILLTSFCLLNTRLAYCNSLAPYNSDELTLLDEFSDVPIPDANAPLMQEDPEKTVEMLSAKANDWREPSQGSEVRYVLAMRRWLSSLDPQRRVLARQILRDSHPGLRALREAIREKKSQLASLSFDRNTKPETLPKLGKELQELRATLRQNLEIVNKRLQNEVGIELEPVGIDGFWLLPSTAVSKPSSHSHSLIRGLAFFLSCPIK